MRARKVYEDCKLAMLPSEVKRHLMILMLSEEQSYRAVEDFGSLPLGENVPPAMTREQLRARIAESDAEVLSGKAYPVEEMEQRLESKFPWLCK